MVDIDDIQGNIIPAVIILLVIAIVFSLVANFGVPLISGIDTYEAPEVVSTEETSNETIFKLNDPSLQDEVVVKVNGQELNWQNGEVRVDRDKTDIVLETYPGGEGLYDAHEYEVNRHQVNLVVPDPILSGRQETFELQSSVSPSRYEDNTRWTIDGELIQPKGTTFIHNFNESGNYTVKAETNIGNIEYSRSSRVEVLEPDEMVLSTNISSTNLSRLESFNFSVKEATNQGLQDVSVDWGNGESTEIKVNESIKYWYDTPGNYTITVFGELVEKGISDEQKIDVTVSERVDEDAELHTVTVAAFDEVGSPLGLANASFESGKQSQTGADGRVQFDVLSGEYNITVGKPGYVSQTRNILVTDDVLLDVGLERVDINEVDQPNSSESELLLNETILEFEDNNASGEQIQQIQEDGLLPNVLESAEGNGTEQSPYKISNYPELQAVSVQPNAYYEIVSNINAGASQNQDTVSEIGPVNVGTGDDQIFELKGINREPERLSVSVNDQEVSSDEYQILTGENNPSVDSDSVYFAFISGEEQVPPSEALDNVGQNTPVTATYFLSTGVSRGFDTIEAGSSIVRIEGNGYEIQNLNINRPLEDTVGIFDSAGGGYIRNLDISANVRGNEDVGTLFGRAENVNIEDVTIGGSVEGEQNVGGVAGLSSGIRVNQTSIFARSIGNRNVGGVLGDVQGGANIENTAVDHLSVGKSVSGITNVGGIVGRMGGGEISNSYAKTAITGRSSQLTSIGGIAGSVLGNSQVTSTYVVMPIFEAPVDNPNTQNIGQIVGSSEGTIQQSYWDSSVASSDFDGGVGSNQGTTNSIEGLDTSLMQGSSASSNMGGLDFDTTWQEQENNYPGLSSSVTTAEDPRVRVDNINSGDEVSLQTYVNVSVENFDLRPANNELETEDGAGHVAVVVGDPYAPDTELPNAENVYTLSDGSKSTQIRLPEPGEYTITAQLVNDEQVTTEYDDTVFVTGVENQEGSDTGGDDDGGDTTDGGDGENGDGIQASYNITDQSSGRTVTEASVELRQGSETFGSTERIGDTPFEATVPEPGSYLLNISANGYVDRRTTIQITDISEFDLTLPLSPTGYTEIYLDVDGSSAYVGNASTKSYSLYNPAPEGSDFEDVNNPSIVLEQGNKYSIFVEDYDQHPIEIVSLNNDESVDETLLSSDGEGTLESNNNINWLEKGEIFTEQGRREAEAYEEYDAVQFTVTNELIQKADAYKCAIHGNNMRGELVTPGE